MRTSVFSTAATLDMCHAGSFAFFFPSFFFLRLLLYFILTRRNARLCGPRRPRVMAPQAVVGRR